MNITHQYRLRPTKFQLTQLEEWLETCRRTYNRMLGERFDWWENNRCAIDRCSIISCGIAPLKEKPNYYSQQNSLVPLKAKYPDIKLVQSQVLQNVVKRVDLAYERFVAGDSNGKRSGRPRFKGKGRYRSLTFTQMKQACLTCNKITLPKLGVFKLVVHRPLPDGFKIKTATIGRLADGWYVSLSLTDDTVPTISPDIKLENAVGIDLGLKDFLVTSNGETVPISQFTRKSEKRRKLLNKSLGRKKHKGTHRRQKAGKRLSKHYQKVARQRKDFHYKTAGWLLNKAQRVTEAVAGVVEKPAQSAVIRSESGVCHNTES